jgi:hypothetical protein
VFTDPEKSRHKHDHAFFDQGEQMLPDMMRGFREVGRGIPEFAVCDEADLVGHTIGGLEPAGSESRGK